MIRSAHRYSRCLRNHRANKRDLFAMQVKLIHLIKVVCILAGRKCTGWREARKFMKLMTKAHILIVEDNQVLCDVLVRNLRTRGHMVSVAHDVGGALDTLKACDIDLVLLDINLPDQTGWDLLRAVNDSPEIHLRPLADGRLPVVILSAVRVS